MKIVTTQFQVKIKICLGEIYLLAKALFAETWQNCHKLPILYIETFNHMNLSSFFLTVFLPFSLLLFSACDNEESMSPSGGLLEPEVETTVPEGTEQYLTLNSDYIFDQEKLHTFELTISEEALAIINNDPVAEQYVAASLTFEGETISPIGVRYKGSIGAFVNCTSGLDWANPSGSKTCTKLSMKIKINWEGREERFYGLRKLQLHSQNLDPTQMRERLGYWLFRQMDVAAPRSVHARLMINGEFAGLFALTEQIDGRFTKYNYNDGSGNLYKEVWPLDWEGNPFSGSVYINALKTNEEENPSAELIRTFAVEVANADSEDEQAVVDKWMNIEEIISYAVVDRCIRADDGPFHWYCSPGGCSNHNYYWYEEPSQGTLHLIPWDMDNAFENIISDENPVTPIADEWGQTRNSCQPFNYGQFQFSQRSAACDKLTRIWASFESEYDERRELFINSSFSEESTNAMLNSWTQQIRAATIEAMEAHNDALSLADWEEAVAKLREKLEAARG